MKTDVPDRAASAAFSSGRVEHVRGRDSYRLRRRLRGDVDTIVLHALCKEPQRRYASVEQFAEDIRRHLEGRPVTARRDSWRYRAGKFAIRHKLGVGATALILMAVLGGVTATVRQARIAAANQRRAENRFNDVRKLANSLMFEIHDSIQALPGSTPARKIIVQRSQEYLDGLAREASGDLSLQRELATAYQKLGEVQGTASGSNLGDAKGALESFRKAMAIRSVILASGSNRIEDRIALAEIERLVGLVLWMDLGASAEALKNVQHAVTVAEQTVRDDPESAPASSELARDYEQLGDILGGNGVRGSAGELAEALKSHHRALDIWKQLAALPPPSLQRQVRLASTYIAVGDDLVKVGEREKALHDYERARDILRPLAQDANNTPLRRSLPVCYSRIGDVFLLNGKPADALAAFEEDLRLIEPLAKADPTDVHLQLKLAGATSSVGHAEIQAGRLDQGRKLLSQAVAVLDRLSGTENDSQVRDYRALITVWEGEAAQRAGDPATALRKYRQSLAIYSALATADSQDAEDQVAASELHGHLGAAYLQSGDPARAADEYHQAYAIASSLLSSRTDSMEILYAAADAGAGLGKVSGALARRAEDRNERSTHWTAASEWYQQSIASWKKIPNPSRFAPDAIEMINLHQVEEEAKIATDHAATAKRATASSATAVASGRRD
jgi:eukaryotic-like serine/threonine-protein kinase